MRREGLQKDSLRNGLKRASSQPLEHPEKYEALEVPRRAAHERAESEQGDGKEKIMLSSE
jgi:hypothetical protein